jgi:hypothetical protein
MGFFFLILRTVSDANIQFIKSTLHAYKFGLILLLLLLLLLFSPWSDILNRNLCYCFLDTTNFSLILRRCGRISTICIPVSVLFVSLLSSIILFCAFHCSSHNAAATGVLSVL